MRILRILRFLFPCDNAAKSFALNLPKVTAVIHFSPLPFKGGGPLLMWLLSLSASTRTLCVPPSSVPACPPSLVIWPHTWTEVSESPSSSALLLPPPAHPRLSLLVVWVRPWCRRQFFPCQPRRRLRRPPSILKTLEVLSKPLSASVSFSSSIMREWGKPSVIIAHHITMRWWPPAIEILLVWVTLMPKVAVIWEKRWSSLAFWVHIFPKVIQVFLWIFSEALFPVQLIPVKSCNDFVRIKVGFLPWKPPENVNMKDAHVSMNQHSRQFKVTDLAGHNHEYEIQEMHLPVTWWSRPWSWHSVNL